MSRGVSLFSRSSPHTRASSPRRSPTIVAGLLCLLAAGPVFAAPITYGEIQHWAGTGANEAGVVIDWNDGKATESLVWGYRWDGSANGTDALHAIVASDARLFSHIGTFSWGTAVFGLGYDQNDSGSFATSPALTFDAGGKAADPFGVDTNANDARGPVDPADHFREGWFGGFWEHYIGSGTSPAWVGGLGSDAQVLSNGAWVGFSFAPGFASTEPSDPTPAAVPEPAAAGAIGLAAAGLLLRRRRRLGGMGGMGMYSCPCPAASGEHGHEYMPMPPRKVTGGAAKIAIVAITVVSAALSTSASADYVYDPNDFAVEVVSSTGPFGAAPYDAPASLLGRPTLSFNSSFNPSAPDLRKSKLIEGIFNTGGDGSKLITTLNEGSQVTVRMGRPVTNDPNNPFGIDFIVFGNAFYAGAGDDVGEDTDLTEYTLSGAIFGEQVKVSVSPNGTNWYRYETGPFGDGAFPTNGYLWDRLSKAWTNVEADPTKPVDPALSVAGKSAADVLDLYAGSAGGTGFDLAPSGFSSIQYIRVEGLSGFSGGEIDAFADVKPVPEPGVAGALAAFAMIALSRRARLA